jgi:D-sedoheptulose 7-phosphate isomerase
MIQRIQSELQEAQHVLERFLADAGQVGAVERAAQTLVASFKAGGKVLACGNGGSACDAMHFCEELTGRFRGDRPALPAICMSSDAAHLSCTANDYGFSSVFSRYLEGLGRQGDVLLAISTSGNSDNILAAAQTARSRGIAVIGLTGKTGGKLAELCDVEIRVPHMGFSDRVQEIHIKVIHILILMIEQEMGYL